MFRSLLDLAVPRLVVPSGFLSVLPGVLLGLTSLLPTGVAHAAPTLLFDQIIGSSYLDNAAKSGPGTWYMQALGPDFGIVRFEPGSATWTRIDAPVFESGTSNPQLAGGHVFFRGIPLQGDGLMHIYVVDGDSSIDLSSSSIYAGFFTDLNGQAILAWGDDANGEELWTSDGTPGGTVLLKDINPTGDSSPAFGATLNGYLYFGADDGANGQELWRTNGTAAGTTFVKDIRPGSVGSIPNAFAEVNGLLVFSANDGSTGNELWRSDGTSAGTFRLLDIYSGTLSSSPRHLTNVNGWVYFSATTSALGEELYRTDGTVVQLIKDIRPGTGGSRPQQFHGYGGEVYFAADDDAHGTEVWKTDGTTAGTQLVYDCFPGSASSYGFPGFVNGGGSLFFVGYDGSYGVWRSDGTSATTQNVFRDLGPSSSSPNLLIGNSNYVYFSGDDGTEVGHEPRRLDVVTNAVELSRDLNTENGSNCEQLTAYGDNLLAISDQYWFGRDLWFYDLDIPTNSVSLDDTGWRESQSPEGATFVVDGDIAYFTGWQEETGFEVGAYDGSDLYQVDVIPGPEGSDPIALVVADGHAYFVALTASGNYGLYRLSAPPSPTATLLQEFGAGPLRELTSFGSGVLFVAEDATSGAELWRAQGQQIGPVLDINPGAPGSHPSSLTPMGDEVYFSASQPATGRELWVTNGTAAGTHLVEEIVPGPTSSSPAHLTNGFPFLYFTASTTATGSEIYAATAFGIDPVDEIVPGPGSADPEELAFTGSRLRFSADDGSGIGREPWYLSGRNPVLLGDLNPGAASSNPRDYTSHLGATYFSAANASLGRELVRVAGGVVSVVTESIAPGTASSNPGDRVTIGDRLYFVAENEAYGRELWYVEDTGGPSDVPTPPVLAGGAGLQLRTGPNPFVDELRLEFTLSAASDVSAELIDAGGRLVERFDLGRREAGTHVDEWSLDRGRGIPSGVYFVRLDAGSESRVRKVLRIE
ncbi:MAG: T9SS type A sorting domain-containing protein [Candidatus Eisenbacteria bacterium]|uniref:T9SS type A sorting domain-containing protein n=1 Tax=Eiseniibacteriota bacterium TaxID=2212470 RepID=A0A956SF02_UNCEI|nr:T9SS type A sorting domain-containing protein [Candidatus Eisenbacteria bacterium]